MVTHEDATAARGNIFQSAHLDLDSCGADAGIRDPHRGSIKKADVSYEQRVGNADDSCDWTEGQIDKDQLERRKHTCLEDTLRETPQADQASRLAELREAMAEGSFS